MNHLKLIILYCLLHLTIAQLAEKKIVCYYTSWSIYRPENERFAPRDINPQICTHLIYAYAIFSEDGGIAPFDDWQDIIRKGYSDFNEIKVYNDKVKTLISIGGWVEGSKIFSHIASAKMRRERFALCVLSFLRKHNFDGINLDWHFPGFRDGSRGEDFENYVKLVKDLREIFQQESTMTKRPRLMVSLSVPSEIEYIEKGFDVINLQKYADFINVLCYDYHLAYDPFVNHHSPLYPLPEEFGDHPNAKLNVDTTIKYLLNKGVQPEILNLGIPAFGRTFILENAYNNGLGAPAKGQGQRGKATREVGYKSYYEICKEVKNDNWTIVNVNQSALGPYAYKGANWVGYDDENIVRKKAEYARDMGLGGIMFWKIDDDDLRGECGSTTGNPLIKAGRLALLTPSSTVRIPLQPPTVVMRQGMMPIPLAPVNMLPPEAQKLLSVPQLSQINSSQDVPMPLGQIIQTLSEATPYRTRQDDGNYTYYQNITIVNNIFNFNFKDL